MRELLTSEKTRLKLEEKEKDMVFSSCYYCPNCTGGGQLFVKDTEAYMKQAKKKKFDNYDYYCKECKSTFNIIEKREKLG